VSPPHVLFGIESPWCEQNLVVRNDRRALVHREHRRAAERECRLAVRGALRGGLEVGFGRIVVLEKEAPIILVNLV
jgi:hypothetical protein